MASPNSTFTEMVTTTRRQHPDDVTDNVSTNNALYRYLKANGKIKKVDGGLEIVVPLDYANNSTFQRYSGFDTLNVAASEVLTSAKFDWVQSAVHVVASGRELRMNSGRNQIIDLADARLTNAKRTAANYMSIDIYSDGTLTNQMGGLGALVTSAGTGTVGGIVSGTYTWWKNQFREMSGSGTWSKSTIKGDMNAMWLTCVRGGDKPDLVVSSHDFFAAYLEALQDNQRYMSTSEAAAGFQSLKYMTADVIFDSNSNFATTAEVMYFLNTNYLGLTTHKDANWSVEDEKMAVNQDGVVIPMLWMGQMTVSNRSLQGKLLDAS